jgi:hypothetical protein
MRPLAKVLNRFLYSNIFKDYQLLINNDLKVLPIIVSIVCFRIYARGLWFIAVLTKMKYT